MAPGGFRKRLGFGGSLTALLTLFTVSPGFAQSNPGAVLAASAPLVMSLGAGIFGIIVLFVSRAMLKDSRRRALRAEERTAGLRALVDDYEGLLAGNREVTILWTQDADKPRVFGQVSVVLPSGQKDGVLQFSSWLEPSAASALSAAFRQLRADGTAFDLALKARDGRQMRATGWVLGSGAALRLRPAFQQISAQAGDKPSLPDEASTRAILARLTQPAFILDDGGALRYANDAYRALAGSLGKPADTTTPGDIVEAQMLSRQLVSLAGLAGPVTAPIARPPTANHEIVSFEIEGGTAGYLQVRPTDASRGADGSSAHVAGVMDALNTPIAIFNEGRELIHFNRAYAEFWRFEPGWLRNGLDERTILDRLHYDNMLPPQSDYQAWRSKHLTSYSRKAPHQSDPWHLPDGRTIKVLSAPAGPRGGVIYVFEDQTERLRLEGMNRSLSDVQRQTLNALSEAVAVFGTNGRLTLSNPRLASLWKLSTTMLSDGPHIDQIAGVAAEAMPEDGAVIWRDLKRAVIDLNPTRSDTTGRITRADGRLLDYAIIKLPDGQSLVTFLDVTDSANYTRVMKERNEALVAADRIRDAYVQNVSYELRSPLTNIIGFSDMLASTAVGSLNERQREYVDYIRASSATLGVLIDGVLDLASVDAGIAELHPVEQNVTELVERARAGVVSIFPSIDGTPPLDIKIDIAPDLPPFVADGRRIGHVLHNLLSNAARFSGSGGEIRLSVRGRTDRIYFIVEDDGSLPSDLDPSLGENAAQSESLGRQRGTTLAFAIVRTFVNFHGGTVSIERREPRGSRVVVSLPTQGQMAGVAE